MTLDSAALMAAWRCRVLAEAPAFTTTYHIDHVSYIDRTLYLVRADARPIEPASTAPKETA